MRTLTLLTAMAFCLATPGFAADARDRDECKEVKEKIRKIQARMRRGYSAKQGIKLNEQLLELRERQSKVCR